MDMTVFTLDYQWNYTDYENDTNDNLSLTNLSHHVEDVCFEEIPCMLLLVVNVVIIMLGLVGNGVVIWIAGFKMKKTVNTTWYLSLALSDFIFCATLPLNTFYLVTSDWIFGQFMCKFTSFVMFLNMFSSIFLLVIISVDRCIAVIFPVWAQNQRTIKKASVIVFLAWVFSVSLSVPPLIFRDIQHHLDRTRCHNNYNSHDTHNSILICRFIFGFLMPFLIIIVCYSIIIFKLRSNQMAKSSKPFKIMTALIGTFFLCWLPYHTFMLAELTHGFPIEIIALGLKIGTSIASANSFLNPILYVFMGSDFRRKFKNSILSKIENAIGEEGRTTSRYLSRSSSMDARTSTHI
ncbi:chemerin-like receptor 1 [Clarias gariepinus]